MQCRYSSSGNRTLTLTPNAKQPCEIHACEIVVEGVSAPDYPLQKKRHSLEYLRTIAHLRPRTNTFNAAFRVRSVAAFAIHRFFNERGFVYAHTPLITGSDCRRRRQKCPCDHVQPRFCPRTEDGAGRLQSGLFRKNDQPDGFRPAGGRMHGNGFR